MTPFSHSPNYAHAHKYALVESKIDACQKVFDELATAKQILQGCIIAKRKPAVKDLKPLIDAFGAYPLGMVDYPTNNQSVLLSFADGALLMAKALCLRVFYGMDEVNEGSYNVAGELLEKTLDALCECHTLVESKVFSKDKKLMTKKKRRR